MKSAYQILFLVVAFFYGLTTNAQQLGLNIAQQHLIQNANEHRLTTEDLNDFLVTDHYTSQGITHIYLRQAIDGIEIQGANAAVHLSNGNVIASDNQFLPGLSKRPVQAVRLFGATDAVASAAQILGYTPTTSFQELKSDRNAQLETVVSKSGISHRDIPARLVYVPQTDGSLSLAWDIAIDEVSGQDYWNLTVDAMTGQILTKKTWTVHCDFGDGHNHDDTCFDHETKEDGQNKLMVANSYNVFAWPVESPNHGSRSIEVSPWNDNPTASPNGWHTIGGSNYTHTNGNNVDAYDDSDDSNGPTGGNAARANGGATLEFDFPWVAGNPTAYKDAAVTNLFYWSNVTHDVWYNYGFDEASGNFQEENYGAAGAGSDYVNAEAQDGSGTCNANFSTPPDGSNPRMQMYLCNGRDGDYDNGVVVHEYGHGISIRLTGGPNTSGCLNNSEQMGEGWSDYFGMVMTIEAGDTGPDSRGMGTWLFGQGANGGGIRPYPYSTNMATNPMTYNTIGSGVSVPHGVGSVWATMLWEMTWALIDEYGWDADIYNGTGGNNIAMALVIEGLKLQPCSPGFVDGRDAILAADQALNGGANTCLIWEAFAKRGLGFSASQGSSGSVSDGTEAFDMPPACSIGLEKTASTASAAPGDNITYTLTATNNTGAALNNVVISDDLPANTNYVSGGSLSGNTVSFPAVSLATGASHSVSFTVQIDPGLNGGTYTFSDDMEGGSGNWSTTNTGSSSWGLQTNQSNSGSSSWFAQDVGTTSIANLVTLNAMGIGSSSTLTFTHNYNTEANWDGGVVEISTNGGTTWTDLGSNMTSNGYNSTINNSRPAFSGNSGGWVTTTVNLASFDGQNALIRFQMNCDVTVSGVGWYIDDVAVSNLQVVIPNTASVTDGNITSTGTLATPTVVTGGGGSPLSVSATGTNVSCFGGNNGTASASASGGTPGYTYVWSNGGTGASISGLSAGTYSVIVTDGAGDTATDNVTITQPSSAVSVSASGVDPTNGSNGSATASASGGTPGYTYAWSNGGTGATISGLSAGTYSVIATDANGCTSTTTVTLTDVGTPLSVSATGTNVSCFGGSNGTATASASGGTSGYTYAWSNGGTGASISGLSAGTYSVIVTDGAGDTATDNVTISAPASAVSVSVTGVNANGGNNGSATASASGGTPGYTYAWSNGGTGSTITGLAPGTYSVVATDANGCAANGSVTILDDTPPPSGYCTSTGTNTTYEYIETINVGNLTNQSGNDGGYADYTNLIANLNLNGTYNVDLTPGFSGTVYPEEWRIWIDFNQDEDFDDSGEEVFAPAGSNTTVSGTIAIPSTASLGTTRMRISMKWGGTPTPCETFTYGEVEDYTVDIQVSGTPLTVSVTGQDVNCNGGADGSATATATGGSGAGYSYVWSTGATTSTVSSLSAGTYSVVVTDNGGNVGNGTVTISEPATSVAVSVTGVNANGGNNGSATASASGGTPGYTYAWSNGGTGQTITGLAPGTYSVIASDANGCSANGTVVIGDDTPPPGGYCTSTGTNTNYEYIDAISVGNLTNQSGNDGGYADYTGQTATVDLNGSYNVSLTPGYASTLYDETWRIWIDFNQDEDFDDPGEEVFGSGLSSTTVNGTISIPSTASLGNTRMRISMKWGGTPTPCETFTYGEVEDYTVNIQQGGGGGGCTTVIVDSNDFEGGWGIWNDGGSDCRRSSNDANYANSGNFCVRLRDNTNTSVMTTDNIDLSSHDEITVDFSYYVRSFDNSNEDFWLQISTDGGATYSLVEEWNLNDEFLNNERKFDAVTIAGPFSATTKVRFRADASGNSDWAYIDDVTITGCTTSGNFAPELPNKPNLEEETVLDIPNIEIETAEEAVMSDLVLYPNPTSNQLNVEISIPEATEVQLLITDMTGKILQTQMLRGDGAQQELQLDVARFAPGFYYVHLVTKTERISEKFVVVK